LLVTRWGRSWNFTKFLVDRDGNVVGRCESTVSPDALRPELAKLAGD
jgi:glutathione peroxidase